MRSSSEFSKLPSSRRTSQKIKLTPAKDEPDAYARSLLRRLGVGQINSRPFGLANRDLRP
jgi:hypothetical protein